MNRRLFLGLIGGSVAAAATPEAFRALVVDAPPAVMPLAAFVTCYITDVCFACTATGIYTIGRAGGMELISTGLAAGGMFRWVAPPGWEIMLPPGSPALVIDGPGVAEWSMLWTEQQDDGPHRYAADSFGRERVPLTIGDLPSAAHRWLTDHELTDAEWDDYPYVDDDDAYDEAGD